MKSNDSNLNIKIEKTGNKRIISLQIEEIPGISEPLSAYIRSEFKDGYLVYMKASGGEFKDNAVFTFEVLSRDIRSNQEIERSLMNKLNYLIENIHFAQRVIAASDLPRRLDLFRNVLLQLSSLPYDPEYIRVESERFFLHRTPEYLYDRGPHNLAREIMLNIKIGIEGLPQSSIPFIELYNNTDCAELNSVIHIATRDVDAGFFLDQINKFRECTISYVKQFFFRKQPDNVLVIHIEFKGKEGEQLSENELQELKHQILSNIQKNYLVDYTRFDVYLKTYYPQFLKEVRESGKPQAIFLPITFSPKTFSLFALFPDNSQDRIKELLNDMRIKPYLVSISWEICAFNTVAIKLYLLTPNEMASEDLDDILENHHNVRVFDRGSRVIATSLLKEIHKNFPSLIAFPSARFLVDLATQQDNQLQIFMSKLKEFIDKEKKLQKYSLKRYAVELKRISSDQAFQEIDTPKTGQFHFCFQIDERWYINIRVKQK